jgi:hypothetical protein
MSRSASEPSKSSTNPATAAVLQVRSDRGTWAALRISVRWTGPAASEQYPTGTATRRTSAHPVELWRTLEAVDQRTWHFRNAGEPLGGTPTSVNDDKIKNLSHVDER